MKFIKTIDKNGQILWINTRYITDITTIRHLGEDGVAVGWIAGHNGIGSGRKEEFYGDRAVQFMMDFHAMLE